MTWLKGFTLAADLARKGVEGREREGMTCLKTLVTWK